MSQLPRTVAIPASLRQKLIERVQERDDAVQRLEEMLELIRGVLADFGTPVEASEYDLFNLNVGFVRREVTEDSGLRTQDNSGPQSSVRSPQSHNGVVIPDSVSGRSERASPAPEEVSADE